MHERAVILGSCVSRDIFNFYESNEFELLEYYARTSLISMMSPVPHTRSDVDLTKIASPFQRRVVNFELTRDALRRLNTFSFDYLLMDFIDERHDVLEIEPGSFVTLTSEFGGTGFLDEHPYLRGSIIQSGSPKFRKLWMSALCNFVAFAKEANFFEKIQINRVHWATHLDDGQKIPGANESYIAKNNELLEWMYHMIRTTFPDASFVNVPSRFAVSTVHHKWGASPFHYADPYYRYMKSQLALCIDSAPQTPSSADDED